MSDEIIEFMSGVLLVSKDPARLAKFYKEVVGLPLEDERHGDTLPHFGCTLGEIHFAIHPIEDFPDRRDGVGAVKLAFNVFDIRALVEKLERLGIKPLKPIEDTGFFLTTAINDPDGNFVEFTQLVDEWFADLEGRRASGRDLISRWHAVRHNRMASK